GSVTITGGGTGVNYNPGTAYDYLAVDESATDTFTYTISDGQGGTDTATVTMTITGTNDTPVVGNATATVSEEGLENGIRDDDGTSDTTDSTTYDSSIIDPNQSGTGQITITDVDINDTHTVTLTAPTDALTSNGDPISWAGSGSQQIVGSANGIDIITISINNDDDNNVVNYSVSLTGPVDHPDPDAEDVVSFNVPVNVFDGTDTSSGALTINVEDDSPTIIADFNAIIANEVGNSLTAPLDINFGGDGPNATTPIDLNGPTDINGYVVDNTGAFLTSDGVNLVYQSDGSGGLVAVKEGTSTQIFSITVDPVAENYTVMVTGPLDGAAGALIDLSSGGTDPGNDDAVYFYGGADTDGDGRGNIQIRITGIDENGATATVNSSNPGMGVNNNWLDNLTGEDPEQLLMVFNDTATTDSYEMTAAEITANSLAVGELAVWRAYDTNGYDQDPSLWTLVKEGTAEGSGNAETTFIVEGDLDPATGTPDTFNAIILEASDGNEYRVFNITTFSSDSGANTTITYYNGSGVNILDADGDGNNTTPAFDVTFEADGNIVGSSENEVIAGSSQNNLIHGSSGDDVISGGSGNDMLYGDIGDDILDGGAGNDYLTGGTGADTFKAGQGDDRIADYSQTEGDVVDISHVIDTGAGDYLEVNKNLDDGTAKLSILDSSAVEKGSITFDNIDYDTDLTNGDELDSLLGQVDIDDGTV
ncbi:MAG: VCBS domain-containing protein, partial [Desulfobulbaceae bacterium]|nr:VCBS domain-containing protein [Desulfobulbaceae bacterium]